MERMIKPETLAMPTEGTVGYVHIEKPQDIDVKIFETAHYEDVDDMVPCIGDYAPYLDDDVEFGEVVETVNIGFTPYNLVTV